MILIAVVCFHDWAFGPAGRRTVSLRLVLGPGLLPVPARWAGHADVDNGGWQRTRRVLIKNAEALERLKSGHVVVDKQACSRKVRRR